MNALRIIEEWSAIKNNSRPKIRYWLPAAAMDEADLRSELNLLWKRGFGGVEIIDMLRSTNLVRYAYKTNIGKDDAWGSGNWNKMVKIIADETQKLGISMDITNGPMWPISMPKVENADHPAALYELTYGIIVCPSGGFYRLKLPERKKIRKEGKTELIHLLAYLETENGVLLQESYQDLRKKINYNDSSFECNLPLLKTGTKWLIFAFYQQPAAEKTMSGGKEFYVIDHLSLAGTEACVEYWEQILKYKTMPSMESIFCDSLEYNSCMDWTPLFVEEFEKRRGYSILPFLPFVGIKHEWPEGEVPGYCLDHYEISNMINQDYIRTLTDCYCEYHLIPLQRLAEKYGKSLRYQVAYGRPLEIQRSALCVEIPENEALGQPAMDMQKRMAAAAHLGRKSRYSFECAAEYSNAYGQDYEDILWWIKRSLMSGMNAQVFHGASYSGAYHGKYSENGEMQGIAWPGFDAFRRAISNYWNRTLSLEDARGCLDAIARMNTIFLKKAKVDCAIYIEDSPTTGKGGEFCLYNDNGILINHGYSYEFISSSLLELPICKVNDKTIDKNGVGYKCLIIPEHDNASLAFLRKIRQLLDSEFPVLWIGHKPVYSVYYSEWRCPNDRSAWNVLCDEIWHDMRLIHVNSPDDVPSVLKKYHIPPYIEFDAKNDVAASLHVDEEKEIKYFILYAYNRVKYTQKSLKPLSIEEDEIYKKGTIKEWYQRPGIKSKSIISVRLEGEGQVYQCNPWSNELLPINFVSSEGYTEGKIAIEEDEMIILALFRHPLKETAVFNAEKKIMEEISINAETLTLECFEPKTRGEISFLRSGFSKSKMILQLDKFAPWCAMDPTLEEFCGRGTYSCYFFIENVLSAKRYILRLGNVSDTFHVYVNGKKTSFPDQVLKEVDITPLVKEGKNKLTIIVVSNLYNFLVGTERDKYDVVLKTKIPRNLKKYGIWEEADKRCSVLVTE
jgi:hypothetical protein